MIVKNNSGKSVESKILVKRRSPFQWWQSLMLALALSCLAGRGSGTEYTVEFFPGDEIMTPRKGIIGRTPVFSGELTAGGLRFQNLFSYMSIGGLGLSNSVSCLTSRSPDVGIGSSGVYGFRLINDKGVKTNAVLLPHGTVTWERRTASGITVKGTVIYSMGRWVNTWSPALTVNEVTGTQSQSDSQGLSGESEVICPRLHQLGSSVPLWATTGTNTRTSSAQLYFFVDAPKEGLAPGKYTASIALFEAGGAVKRDILIDKQKDTLKLVEKPYSCHISAPTSVTLTNSQPNAEMMLFTACKVAASNSGAVNVNLAFYAAAAGFSASQFNSSYPQRLPVVNSNMFILANWGSFGVPVVSKCTGLESQAVLFDGKTVVESFDRPIAAGYSDSWTRHIKFRLCPENLNSEAPGEYTAHAIFSIVTP